MLAASTRKRILIAIVLLVLLILAYFILPVSLPLILSFFFALALVPLVHVMMRFLKVSRAIAVTLVFSGFMFVLAFVVYILTVVLIARGLEFYENVPTYIAQLNEGWLQLVLSYEAFFSNVPGDIVNAINNQMMITLNSLRASVSELDLIAYVTAAVSSIPGYFISFLVFLIALFLFMLEMPKIQSITTSYMKEETREKVEFMAKRFVNVIVGFLKAQFIVSIPIFIVSYIALLFITPEVALTMAVVIWIIDLIPLIGSIVVLTPWALYLFLVGDSSTAVQLLILAAVLLVIRRTVEPKVMGVQIGLSPLATLIAMYLGVSFMGFIGFLVGPLILIAFKSAKEAGMIKLNVKI